MELIAYGVAIAIGLVLIGLGIVWGWNMSVRKFGRNAADLTQQVERLDEIAQRDPARMGIDIGKRYATDKMRETLRDLDAEIDT